MSSVDVFTLLIVAHLENTVGRYANCVCEKIIVVSAVVFLNTRGEILHVRKKDTEMFMLPGGKPEAGESAQECAIREILEELGISLAPEQLEDWGMFVSRAANEEGYGLQAHVFYCAQPLTRIPQPAAEIAQVRWFSPTATDELIAPLNTEHVFQRVLSL